MSAEPPRPPDAAPRPHADHADHTARRARLALEAAPALSAEVLAFAVTGRKAKAAPPPPGPESRARHLERARRLVGTGGRDRLLLFGLGSGALFRALAEALPEGRLLCLELDPETARAVLAGAPPPPGLLTDASPWSLFCLAALAGFDAERAVLLLNPELSGRSRDRHRALQRTLARAERVAPPAAEPDLRDLTLAAILRPDEPGLDAFFAALPAGPHGLGGLALVWDAEAAPDAVPALPDLPVRQAARPLAGDFAAQRNRALALCATPWVLFLDADERLDPETWARLPGLMAAGAQGIWLARTTYYPDAARFRAGLGLWPDLQLRLFRRVPGAAFAGRVHERLTGLPGPTLLAPDLPIRHLTHLAKAPEEIRRKLRGFDQAAAAEARPRHTLNRDYPTLPADPALFGPPGPGAEPLLLRLPDEAGPASDRVSNPKPGPVAKPAELT